MSQRIDLTGVVFGSWTVLKFSGSRSIGGKGASKPFWLCRCACGMTREVEGASLRHGLSVGCGCTKGPAISKARTKHGHLKNGITPTYWSWQAMHARVKNPRYPTKKYYMDLGITVCARWNSFERFLEDMGERPPGASIDRIDGWGNYEPANCRWTDAKTQRRNRRKPR